MRTKHTKSKVKKGGRFIPFEKTIKYKIYKFLQDGPQTSKQLASRYYDIPLEDVRPEDSSYMSELIALTRKQYGINIRRGYKNTFHLKEGLI